MKIFILNRSINQGGIDLVGQEVAESLAKTNEVYLCTFFLREDHELGSGVSILTLNIPPSGNPLLKILNNFLRFIKFKSFVNEFKPDIVIAQGNIPNIIVGLDKKLGARYKTILTVHNTLSKDLTGFTGAVERTFLKLIKRNANAWVADSDYVSEDFRAIFGANNLVTIPNPVSNYPKDERAFERKFIFTAGRLVPQKDYATLIRAFSLVVKETPTVDLKIAGEGEQLNDLKNLVKELKIENRVQFIGYENNLYSYLKESEFFVSSSVYEGMPMVVLQALSLGKGIVATKVPGTMDAVGKAGLYSDVGNEKELAKNMTKVLKDNQLKSSLEKEALVRAIEFSGEEVGKKWIKLLESL